MRSAWTSSPSRLERNPKTGAEVAAINVRCLDDADGLPPHSGGLSFRVTRADAPCTFALPDHVACEMKDQLIGTAWVDDVVLDFVSCHRLIAHGARLPPSETTVDQRNELHWQAPFLDSLLHARSQLTLRQDRLGRHYLRLCRRARFGSAGAGS